MKKSPKKVTPGWFVPIRGSYLPRSWQGWLTYLPFAGYLIFAAVYSADMSNNLAQFLLYVVPNWTAATVVMTWIAKRMS